MTSNKILVNIPRILPKTTERTLAVAVTPTALSKTIDMDALFGHAYINDFTSWFKGDIVLNIDDSSASSKTISSHHLIKNSKYKIGSISVKTLPSIKLGVCQTNFGTLDIFIVFKNLDSVVTDHYKLVYRTVSRFIQVSGTSLASGFFIENKKINSNRNNQISGNILNSDIIAILNNLRLQTIHHEPAVYFETLGNKRSTITSSMDFDEILKRILITFRKDIFPFIIIDICTSISAGDHKVTLANENFFNALGLTPNFKPLFSNSMLNLHRNTIKQNGTLSKTGKKFYSSKLNFYSTFEYHLNFDKSKNYMYSLSSALMLTNLWGNRTFAQRNKFLNLAEKYKNINLKQAENGNGTCIYRIELRCRLSKTKDVIEKIGKYITLENFECCDSKDFFKILQKNIDMFLTLINPCNNIVGPSENSILITPNVILKSIISEAIMKNLFLSGGSSCCPLDKIQNRYILDKLVIYNIGFANIGNLQDLVSSIVTEKLTDNQKNDIFLNQIKYSQRLNSTQKFLLEKIPYLYFQNHPENIFIENILNLYCVSLTNNTRSTFEILKNIQVGDNYICANKAIRKIVLHSNMLQKSSLSKILFKIFCEKFSYNDEVGISKIFNYMKDNGIVKVFKNVHGEVKTFKNLLYAVEDVRKLEKDNLIKRIIAFDLSPCEKISKTFDEKESIRYLHALYKYRNSSSRIINILHDFAYGFYPVRNETWLKNRIHFLTTFIKSENCFIDYINKVKQWSPNEFTLNQRRDYWAENKILHNEEFLTVYDNLLEIDLSFWNISGIRNEIIEASPSDIFFSSVKNSFAYRSKIDIIKFWSDRYIRPESSMNLNNQMIVMNDANSIIRNTDVDNQLIIRNEIVENNTFNDYDISFDNNYDTCNYMDVEIDNVVECLDSNDNSPATVFLENQPTVLTPMLKIEEKQKTMYESQILMRNLNLMLGSNKNITELKTTTTETQYDRSFYNLMGHTLINFLSILSVQDNQVKASPINEKHENESINCLEINQSQQSILENKFEFYEKKLFKKYRYRRFNISSARYKNFNIKNRPSVKEWNQFIDKLIFQNKVSRLGKSLNEFVFNIYLTGEKYLNFNYAQEYIKKSLISSVESGITGFSIRHKFSSSLRPSASIWTTFLKDRVLDNDIKVLKIFNDVTYYSYN